MRWQGGKKEGGVGWTLWRTKDKVSNSYSAEISLYSNKDCMPDNLVVIHKFSSFTTFLGNIILMFLIRHYRKFIKEWYGYYNPLKKSLELFQKINNEFLKIKGKEK